MQLLAKFKNILDMGFRATLNFRKFKVPHSNFQLVFPPRGGELAYEGVGILIVSLRVACVTVGNLPVNTVCELVHKSLSETPNELLRSV